MTNARRSGAYTAVASEAAKDPMSFLSRVTAVPGMVRDVLLGRYTGLGKGKLFLMLLAVGYIVSPIDLLPEAILTIPGLADDAVVAAWLIGSVLTESTRYLEHRGVVNVSENPSVVQGEIIRP
jgi:uncharacterized membrane protein YkvA (DUF1232 family)